MAHASNPLVRNISKLAVKVIGFVSIVLGVIALMGVNFFLSGLYYSKFFGGLQASFMGHTIFGNLIGWGFSAGFSAIQLGFWGRVESLKDLKRDTKADPMTQFMVILTGLSLIVDACATAGTVTSAQGVTDGTMFLSYGPMHYWIMVIAAITITFGAEPLVQVIVDLPKNGGPKAA